MKEKRWIHRTACAVLTVALCLGMLSAAAVTIPARAEIKSGSVVYKNEKAVVDASNLAEGFVSVKYTGGKDVRIKVLITKSGQTTPYQYNLNNAGNFETFPLTEGDGDYDLKVYENTTGDKYATAFSTTVTLKLRDAFLPFLYSNQYVNFSSTSNVVTKAAELTKDKTDDLSKVTEIYHYAINNISYDYDLAANVQSGYLPDVDAVLKSGKGICFDYAAVMTAMLRSQGIPCKLVVGYAGKTYHAWINVYISGTGWVDNLIQFDGTNWSLMDPTFISNSKGDPKVAKYVGDGANYTQKYAY